MIRFDDYNMILFKNLIFLLVKDRVRGLALDSP